MIRSQSQNSRPNWAPPRQLPAPKALPAPQALAPPELLTTPPDPADRVESTWAPPVLPTPAELKASDSSGKVSLKDQLLNYGRSALQQGILAVPGVIGGAVSWTAQTARKIGAETVGNKIEQKHKDIVDKVMDKATPLAAFVGPKAAPVQAARGLFELSSGLKHDDKEKQLKGMANTTAATGLVLTAVGLGLPGIALAGLATGGRYIYGRSETFQKGVDKVLSKAEPVLGRVNSAARTVVRPFTRIGKRVLFGAQSTQTEASAQSNPEEMVTRAPETLAVFPAADIWGNSYQFQPA